MNYRILGKTGLKVSEVGFGTWQLGTSAFWGNMSDMTAHDMVKGALEAGCTLFDTAPNYADTNSERLLGEALGGERENVVLVSKFGHKPDGGADFSEEWMYKSLHESLKRLRTDYLDVFLLHSPPPECQNGSHQIWSAMEKAREQGKIRFYGASVDYYPQIKECLETSPAQVLEVLFNILHQDARRAYDLLAEKEVGMLAKVPLDSGWLSGKYHAESQFKGVRGRWTPEQVHQRAALIDDLDWLVSDGETLAQKAIAYILSYSVVSSVIPGARSLVQLQENMSFAGKRLSEEHRRRLEEFWNELTDDGSNLLPW